MAVTQQSMQGILHGIWKKAWREGGVTIPCQSVRDALRLRFSLYGSVKGIRAGKVVPEDEELGEAVRGCTIMQDGVTLRVVPKTELSYMQAAVAALGDEAEGAREVVMLGGEEEAEVLRRTLARVEEEENREPPTATPYYTREGK